MFNLCYRVLSNNVYSAVLEHRRKIMTKENFHLEPILLTMNTGCPLSGL